LWVELRQTEKQQPQQFLGGNLRFFSPDANGFYEEQF
jgi:hypothetical protein